MSNSPLLKPILSSSHTIDSFSQDCIVHCKSLYKSVYSVPPSQIFDRRKSTTITSLRACKRNDNPTYPNRGRESAARQSSAQQTISPHRDHRIILIIVTTQLKTGLFPDRRLRSRNSLTARISAPLHNTINNKSKTGRGKSIVSP